MAEEMKNTSEVQEETEQTASENETVTEVQEDSPEATAGEEAAEETSEEKETAEEKTEGKTKTSFFGKKKKDKKNQQIEELTDRLKRSMAEFDNFRKRTEKEKSGMYIVGAKEIIENMLPVVDNFEREIGRAHV